MNKIELLKILENYPLFGPNDIAKILNKKPSYIKLLTKRMYDKNQIYRIERGKYTLHKDALVFASHIRIPSYLGLWTALRFNGLTTQLPKTIFVCSPVERKDIIFYDQRMKFVKAKHFWGYQKYRYENFEIFVSDNEKTLIDCLLSARVPVDEIMSCINKINARKLVQYAKKTKNNSLIKRVGYILETKKHNCYGLEKLVKPPYIAFDMNLEKKGKLNKKWKLIIIA